MPTISLRAGQDGRGYGRVAERRLVRAGPASRGRRCGRASGSGFGSVLTQADPSAPAGLIGLLHVSFGVTLDSHEGAAQVIRMTPRPADRRGRRLPGMIDVCLPGDRPVSAPDGHSRMCFAATINGEQSRGGGKQTQTAGIGASSGPARSRGFVAAAGRRRAALLGARHGVRRESRGTLADDLRSARPPCPRSRLAPGGAGLGRNRRELEVAGRATGRRCGGSSGGRGRRSVCSQGPRRSGRPAERWSRRNGGRGSGCGRGAGARSWSIWAGSGRLDKMPGTRAQQGHGRLRRAVDGDEALGLVRLEERWLVRSGRPAGDWLLRRPGRSVGIDLPSA